MGRPEGGDPAGPQFNLRFAIAGEQGSCEGAKRQAKQRQVHGEAGFAWQVKSAGEVKDGHRLVLNLRVLAPALFN
jgi:hypothetical protein